MEYQATAKYIRVSPRKTRIVARSLRGKSLVRVGEMLAHVKKSAAEPLRDVLASAVANAKQKNASLDALKIKALEVMEGPVMKRFRAVSRGMAHTYKKRMTHIRIILSDETKQEDKK